MKRYFTITAVALCSMLFLATGCDKFPVGESGEKAEPSAEIQSEKGEKGKFEMTEEVPPAPSEEEFVQKQEQKEPEQKQEQEEPAQKQTQKQMF